MKRIKKLLWVAMAILIIGYLIPEGFQMPVERAGKGDYNQQSFWHYPWGTSITHKGVDVFAKKGTHIHSSTWIGLAFRLPEYGKGGKCVLVLGPKWKMHYYAHMNEVNISPVQLVTHSSTLGTVGNSGNAGNTPAHLHYSITTLIPYPWKIDDSKQGWLKMLYLNPVECLDECFSAQHK